MYGIKSLTKYSLVFLSGIGFQQLYSNKKVNLMEAIDAKTSQFRDYLNEHKFIYPKIYDSYLSFWDKDHFLEKLILKESNGLLHYKIFFPEEFLENIFKEDNLQTVEEKLKYCKMSCVFTASSSLQGHMDVVHGGFLATIIDNLYGYLGTLSNDLKPCATANLNINYKKPVKVGEEYIIKLEVSKIDGRKVYITAKIEDHKGQIHTESTALMISVNWGTSSWKKMFTQLHNISKLNENPTEKQQNLILQKDSSLIHPENMLNKEYLKLDRPISRLYDLFIPQ
ncbi:hypothetical protein ABPG72_016932 [Tetrahymena utriculariae]